ncbi:MAG: hypothetical protein JHC53_07945, partial [Thermoleophilia bacterium]|nr:hypothetical protein [Thermoleophilia bacterium]
MTIPPRRRMPRGLVLLAAAAITSVAGTAAHATEGNLYTQGQGGFSTGALATASQVNAATVQVNA